MQSKSTIGVVGAGVMGTGVAQKFAQYGFNVILIDKDSEILKKSIKSIKRNLQIHNMLASEKIDIKQVLDYVVASTDYHSLKNCDLVIENIPEVLEYKVELYGIIDKICKSECIFLVNTSCISITEIGAATNRADRVIGVHFMNPVHMQKFAEVIKGFYTSAEVIERARLLLKSIGMDCTVIHDSVGFVSNRLSHIFMNEAMNLVYEGIADPEQIDMIFTEGFHHKMGPLHTADLIGLDTVKNSLKVLYDGYQEDKFKCSPLLKMMVDAKLLGQKSGKGFFEY